jgi:hypothetical protein
MPARGKKKNEAFHALKAALGLSVKPILRELGFRPFKSKAAFPERYFRDRDSVLDVVEFQFDKYARPAFRIDFRPIEDAEDLETIAKDAEEMWMWNTGYTASPTRRKYAWFKLTLFERLFAVEKGIDRVCRVTSERVLEIDLFLRGGEPTVHFAEMFTWGSPTAAAIGLKPPKRRLQ